MQLPGLGPLVGALAVAVAAVASSFSGLFTTTAGTSTVTSAARTYTLGAGNSGQVSFTSVSYDGGGSFQYSINGGSFIGNDITEGLIITLSNGQTLRLRATTMTSGNTGNANINDVSTGTVLENATLMRS